MNKQITLLAIAAAIQKTCAVDQLSPKPLTLKKYEGGNKNKSLGRMLLIHFASHNGIDRQDIMTCLEMEESEYEKRLAKIEEYLLQGAPLFQQRSDDRDEPALYFYRKMKIIESILYKGI